MGSIQKSLRIPQETARAIEELGSSTGTDFSTAANQLLDEAVRMRRCPGIVFTSGASGRRATIAGAGIDVWEIVAAFESLGRDLRRLQKTYHWLPEPQIRAALAYYELYPDEIDDGLRRNVAWTPSSLRRRHPTLASSSTAQTKPTR